MAGEQIIRHDVVQLDFITNLKKLTQLNDAVDDLKKEFAGGIGDEAFDDLKKSAEQSKKPLENLKQHADKLKNSLVDVGKKGATVAFNGLKKVAGVSFKALTVGLGAAAAAIGKVVYESYQAVGTYEQLKGGMEKIFDQADTSKILKDANEAYKTLGMSANQYLTVVNDTGATFAATMGDQKGYETAKTGLTAISDYATGTGKNIDLLSEKFTLITRSTSSYQSIADQFSGILPATSKDFLKQATAAGLLTKKYEKLTDVPVAEYQEAVAKMLEKGVKDLGLTGNTVMEAEETVTGSLGMMKSAWENLLVAMGTGVDLDKHFDNMIEAAGAFGKQILPVVEKSLESIGKLVEKLAPIIADKLPQICDDLLPPLLKAATALLKGFIKALPTIVKTIIKELPDILKGVGEAIVEAFGGDSAIVGKFGEALATNAQKVAKAVPFILGAFGAFKLLKHIVPTVLGLFSKSDKKTSGGGFFSNIAKSIANLGKVNSGKLTSGMKNLAVMIGGFTLIAASSIAIFALMRKIADPATMLLAATMVGAFGGMAMAFVKLGKPLVSLGKIKAGSLTKGMANLAVITLGISALAGVAVVITSLATKVTDIKTMYAMVGIITAIGAVGAALVYASKFIGNIPVSTVAKGLANMAIMIGGLSALVLLIGAVSLIKFDYSEMFKLVGVIGALGVVGAALSVLGGIVGIIPVSSVALGLANMAIIIAGMTALVLLIGAASLLDFDYKRILQLTGLIGVLGTVGAKLTAFAGIVGAIPIPVVLAGLANMALVLGGVTLLILAFGKLSEIKGFNEFITKGGDTLAKLFNVIGKMVGSLIGGLGEGITNSLPTIGKNLASFATSLKPMFTMFSGVDMGGVGEFFSAIGSFMLKMAGSSILEFFGGKTDFSGVAEGLKSLTTEGVKKFFVMVNSIDAEAFTKGKKFFECLDGISALPNTGGIGQLFSGENDFSGVASGLKTLSGEGVKKFFTMVSGFEENSFTNAEKFFESLDGISSLPNVGGLGQLFSGENDFSGVADGLKTLSGKGVKAFFTMVSGLDESVFEKTKKLFEALADIGNVGKEGFWTKVGKAFTGDGEEKSGISKIASQLSSFAEKTATFFTQVNSLNLKNLNGLWKSLENAGKLTTDNLAGVIDESISTLVDKISKLPQKMGDALKNNSKGLSDGFVSMWKDAVEASVAPVNKLLDGANHILKEFGSKKRVITWKPYAKGTDGHAGGNALVNDGRGAELVQMPNGDSFIPQGRNVFIPNAPKGMKVMSAEQTAQLFGKGSPTFRYAKGIGDIDIWSYIDNASGLVDEITKDISYKGMSSFASSLGKGMVSTFSGEMSAWIDKLFEEEGAMSIANYVASKGVSQWKSTVIRALKMEGQYSAANVKRTLHQMQTESGGNPRAINLWDSNAKRGIPSKGLMQVIDPTFKSYARKGFNKNVYDPLSNILASIRYAVSRYGSLAKAYRGVGYANGGIATKPSIFGEDGAEMAIPLSAKRRKRGIDLWETTGEMLGVYSPESDGGYASTQIVEHNSYAPHFELHVEGTTDAKDLERKVKKWIAESMTETLKGLENKTRRVREV